MSSVVRSILETGTSDQLIDIECQLSSGLPNIVIVGFANKSIDEAKERVRSAFSSSKLEIPRKRIIINLAPADVPKDGSSFDLAIACSILAAAGMISQPDPSTTLVIGELGLDGSVRAVRGIIGKLLAARKLGYTGFFVPADNVEQASLVPGISLYPAATLRDIYMHMSSAIKLKAVASGRGHMPRSADKGPEIDFSDIAGQSRAKRAMEIAAAGSHNILLSGTPGSGKSMLAKALPTILPPMNREEILEVTHLHSLADKQYSRIITTRPFRTPHHTSSQIAVMGGGQYPRPGEVSLAHRGVLVFDELPEYGRATLEAMRQPLEDHTITIARAKDSLTFPAAFILVATKNPCPCGYYGSSKACTCLPQHIYQYNRKLSGPIMDRIDLTIIVDEIEHRSLLGTSRADSSEVILKRVMNARRRQQDRYGDPLMVNGMLTNRMLKRYLNISDAGRELLDQAAERLGISARSYMRTLKVAQTICDLAGEEMISTAHISEALQYRHQETPAYA